MAFLFTFILLRKISIDILLLNEFFAHDFLKIISLLIIVKLSENIARPLIEVK